MKLHNLQQDVVHNTDNILNDKKVHENYHKKFEATRNGNWGSHYGKISLNTPKLNVK